MSNQNAPIFVSIAAQVPFTQFPRLTEIFAELESQGWWSVDVHLVESCGDRTFVLCVNAGVDFGYVFYDINLCKLGEDHRALDNYDEVLDPAQALVCFKLGVL